MGERAYEPLDTSAGTGSPRWTSPAPSVAKPKHLPPEDVVRGLAFALGGVLVGTVATVVVWRLGFVASITSFALAALAAYLYTKGAGTTPRVGLIPLLALIILGVAASFFAVVASDAWDAYSALAVPGSETRSSFISRAVVDPDVLQSYGRDMAMFFVFAALGVFGTLRRLVANPTASSAPQSVGSMPAPGLANVAQPSEPVAAGRPSPAWVANVTFVGLCVGAALFAFATFISVVNAAMGHPDMIAGGLLFGAITGFLTWGALRIRRNKRR